MKSYAIERARHLVLRAGEGDVLPDDVLRVLEAERVTCGWVRASGVLSDVQIRVHSPERGGLAEARRITGPVQALAIEGSIGLDGGEPSMGLHAVLARETDRGMEVLAGEIVSARVVALEALVTAFDDLAIGRALDPKAKVVLFGDAADARYRPDDDPPAPAPRAPAPGVDHPGGRDGPPARREDVPSAAAPSAWSDAIAASAEKDELRPQASRNVLGGAIPPRPARPQRGEEQTSFPEVGDIVEHFAFGRSEVLKSDGERLHLKVGKDGRIREIALEMLKVSPLESNGPHRRFKLDRKM
jgi:predicted DNA-binding protein with PD1-like motif